MYTELIEHLETHDTALRVPRGGVPVWDDEAWHAAEYGRDPGRYALLAFLPGARPWQRARILLRLLLASRTDLTGAARATVERATNALVLGLPPSHVLSVLLAARRRRANHKHVTRATMRLLLDHPHAEDLIRTRRATLVDCFEHALGKATARGCARRLDSVPEDRAYLHRALLRFGSDPVTTARRVRALYAPTVSEPVGAVPALVDLDLPGERPATVTATNRGDIAATLVHLYRGGPAAELRGALDGYVGAAAAAIPPYPGTVAVVLDLSGSMRGYGDREWAAVSQAVAFCLVLRRVCARVVVVPVGGGPGTDLVGRVPAGPTDLAGGVLDAVAAGPDVVAVVSDGYENVYPGDLDRVAVSLPRVHPHVAPVVFCNAAYGHSDDLALRRPAPRLPERTFWHEADFGPLALWLLAHAAGDGVGAWLAVALRQRLAAIETILEGST
jgi:hypothetical protein